MQKLHILLIGIILSDIAIWADENPSVSEGQSVNSPEVRQLHKNVRENLKKNEIYWRSKDFSVYTTEELFDFIPPGSTSISSILAREELKKRPEEVRVILENELKQPKHTLERITQIPYLAGIVGTDYQVEVAKRCLFREEMKEADMMLRIQEDVDGYGIFSLIAQSKHDESVVLDKLIDEGRLEQGSEFELKWRKILSGGDKTGKSRANKSELEKIRRQDRQTLESPKTNPNRDSSLSSNYLALGSVIALLGILVLLFKVWKRNSAK